MERLFNSEKPRGGIGTYYDSIKKLNPTVIFLDGYGNVIQKLFLE